MTLPPIALVPSPKSQIGGGGGGQASTADAEYGSASPAVGVRLKLVATNSGGVTSYSAVTRRGFCPGGFEWTQTAAAFPLGSTATSTELLPCPGGERKSTPYAPPENTEPCVSGFAPPVI